MKRTIFGAVIAIISVGIGPAMLAGPSAVLADEVDDHEHEEGEEHPHDPENGGGGGGGGFPVDELLNLPSLESLRDEIEQRIDLPELKLVGPNAPSGDAVRDQVAGAVRQLEDIEPHKPKKGCCGLELTPEQDAFLHTVPDVPDPPNLPKDEIVVPQINQLKDEVIEPRVDLVEDLKAIKTELDVR